MQGREIFQNIVLKGESASLLKCKLARESASSQPRFTLPSFALALGVESTLNLLFSGLVFQHSTIIQFMFYDEKILLSVK